MGYRRAGFVEVVGVDNMPQPNYPFTFIQADALEFLRTMPTIGFYDAIHASPPCQRWSSKTTNWFAHPDLVTPIRELLIQTGLPYIIENVLGAPLREPFMLCGSSFGLGVKRHRLFESNQTFLTPPCAHGQWRKQYQLYDHGKHYESRVVHVFGKGGGKGKEQWAEAMGIDWMTNDELVEAIPPAYTEMIGAQLLSRLAVHA
jgi:DNA (cytosine-5)-methyltransferase 1